MHTWLPQVEDLTTGEYVSSFSAVKAGAYQVSAMQGGINIAGSPFTAVVAPAGIDAATSYFVHDSSQSVVCGQKVQIAPRPDHTLASAPQRLPERHQESMSFVSIAECTS